jgi:hypothetical protein
LVINIDVFGSVVNPMPIYWKCALGLADLVYKTPFDEERRTILMKLDKKTVGGKNHEVTHA